MRPQVDICTLLIIFGLDSLVHAIVFDEVSSIQVWLTVDSLAKPAAKVDKAGLISRQIELNWLNAPLDPDGQDYIALYLDGEPEDHLAVPVSIHRPTSTHGRVSTHYYLPYIDFYNETLQANKQQSAREYNQQDPPFTTDYQLEGSESTAGGDGRYSFGSGDYNNRWHQYNSYGSNTNFGGSDLVVRSRRRQASSEQPTQIKAKLTEECLGYCIAYHDGQGRILARSCLRTNPNWMQEAHLGSRSLPSLMLPGTHNSGTYPKHLDRSVLQMINKYQINQEESIFNQLVYGIRYLDLRVGFSRVKQRPNEELWIYHDIFRTENSVDEVFEQVRKFLEMTSDELVVLDFHRFTVGFQNENMKTQLERHSKLLDLLFRTLGDWIVPSYLGQHAPVSEFIDKGKRLIVCYAGRASLLGSQSDQPGSHSFLFGALVDQHSKDHHHQQQQPVRDIDAEKQDHDHLAINSTSLMVHQQPQPEPQQDMDRRVGTRIYNRLKSLKLISHSFSKRSIPAPVAELKRREHPKPKVLVATSNVYKKQIAQPDRSMKVLSSASSALPVAESMSSKLSLLFNSVRHIWPNTDTETGLKQFIEESTCRKYFGELRSLMAEMTPGVFGAISDQYDGIRRMSHLTNRMVTDQIRSKFLHCINMVASDYFLGNNLIRLSIYANKMRIHQRNVDLNSIEGGQCKSFRRIEHLLDKSRVSSSTNTIASMGSTTASQTTNTQTYQAHPDGGSDLFSFFKRIFNF